MAVYKVKSNQNIWDVAIHLYGTIEGMFDLLISNPKLTMTSDLHPGMELEYHDYFVLNKDVVSGLQTRNLIPSNGERHVYYRHTNEPLIIVGIIPAEQELIDLYVSGEGVMLVDWGDNTALESIVLTHFDSRVIHYFDNVVDSRQIKIYGDFNILHLDVSKFVGDLLPVRPVVVDEFTSNENANSLKGLFLFENTVKVDLRGMLISDLSSILNMSLQELDLRQVKLTDIAVLDDYLVGLVDNYGSRRDCTVYLDIEPTDRGMSAIQTIISEPAWNEAGKWKFIINDVVYTQE